MKAAAAVEAADWAVRSAMEAAGGSAVSDVSSSSVSSSDKAASVVAGASVESAAAKVWSATVESVIPGAGSDEDAIGEPTRSVVSVRRAGVRSVIIVAVGACGRSAGVAISGTAVADANAEPDLRLGLDQRKRHQYTE